MSQEGLVFDIIVISRSLQMLRHHVPESSPRLKGGAESPIVDHRQ